MPPGLFRVPPPVNEPVLDYRPGDPARAALRAELTRRTAEHRSWGPIIDGTPVRTGRSRSVVIPHDHHHALGTCDLAGPSEVERAISAAMRAKPDWAAMPWEDRASIFLRAAELLAGKFRARLNAATMLGQSKTAHQAEIDAACELVDFFRFNVSYLARIMEEQPLSPPGIWNRVEARPLDGFVFAISPFNFTSIAGNLPTAPALCGNTVVWKPASTALESGVAIMELLAEAGLPPGVINFVPGPGATVGDAVIASPDLGGVHFTGSTGVFQSLWQAIGTHLPRYRQYPRIVGETGGKDFLFVHSSADVDEVVTALVRGAFEYQGQKCSAVSRAYVPTDLWPRIRERLADILPQLGVGDPSDFTRFMGAVIDESSYQKLRGVVTEAKAAVGGAVTEVLGGHCDDQTGWFVHPTIVVTPDPRARTMREEFFGPILGIHVYPESDYAGALAECERTSEYALTGAVFARDRAAIIQAQQTLRFAAGNFYVNDKPTGAVVGQQPFGGSRASGTNDKAGSLWNLGRWISPRTIKENLAPPTDWRYPFMSPDA